VFPKDHTLFPPFIIGEIKRSGGSKSTTPYYQNEVSFPNKLQQDSDVEDMFSYSYTLIVVVVREEIVRDGKTSDLLDVIYRYIPQLSLWVKINGVYVLEQDASFTPNSDPFFRANVTMVVYSKDADNTTTSVVTERKREELVSNTEEEDHNDPPSSFDDCSLSDNLTSPHPAASAGSTGTVYSGNVR
jgi:hypothetical protein